MKTLIEMVHEVYGEEKYWTEEQLLQLKAFAALVRADEREARAKVCDVIYCDYYANTIRARKNT
jgi:inorganic pyrophosphatase